MSDVKSILGAMKKMRVFANVLDEEGFSAEARLIRADMISVMMTDEFGQLLSHENGSGERYAIRGYVDRGEWWRSVLSNAAGGAAFGSLAPGGGTLAGAVGGALYGGLSQPVSDWWYRNFQGKLTRARAQAEDFVNAANAIARQLQAMGAQTQAGQITQIAASMRSDVEAAYQARYQQLRSQYADLQPAEASAWDRFKAGLKHPGQWLEMKGRMRESAAARSGMRKFALGEGKTNALGDAVGLGADMGAWSLLQKAPADAAKAAAKAPKGLWTRFWKGFGAPAVGYGVGQWAAGLGYDKISAAMRGKLGQLMGMASDLGRIAGEISRQMGDPRYIQYAISINRILSTVEPQLSRQMETGFSKQYSRKK